MAATLAELRRKSRQRRARPIQRVVQTTCTSCGVACVAMLARLSFRDAKSLVSLVLKKAWDQGNHRTYASDPASDAETPRLAVGQAGEMPHLAQGAA